MRSSSPNHLDRSAMLRNNTVFPCAPLPGFQAGAGALSSSSKLKLKLELELELERELELEEQLLLLLLLLSIRLSLLQLVVAVIHAKKDNTPALPSFQSVYYFSPDTVHSA